MALARARGCAGRGTPPGATSITAHGPGNALVAGLANEMIDVSASLEGPWQTLGVHGSAPAYP